MKNKSVLFDVLSCYMECKQFVTGSSSNAKLVEAANDFIIDVDRVIGAFTPDMSEEEKEDVLITQGLYPLKGYFE